MASTKSLMVSLNLISLILAFSFIFLADIPEEPLTRIMGLSVADSNFSYINESIFGLGYVVLIITLILNVRSLIKMETKKV